MSHAMAVPDPDALTSALSRILPAPIVVTDLQRVTGGASRETWLFTATHRDGSEGLVLRRDPGKNNSQTERATEYNLLAAAGDAGVAVPQVRMLLQPEDNLGDGFIMDRVDGETIARKILRDEEFAAARPLMAAQCGTILAAVHRIAIDATTGLRIEGPEKQIHQWRAALDGFGEPHAAFELGLRWMSERIPMAIGATAVVHGDFRNGNFIVGPDGIRAILDWELAHLGDPIEDLGWLCVRAWRFGNVDQPVGGFGSIPQLLDAYEAAGGRRPTDDELRFWIAMGTIKWGVICMSQAFTHLSGAVRSVELAAIGRRVAENEWDLLKILDGEW